MSAPSFTWTDREVRVALGLPLDACDQELVFTDVSTDSRSTRAGDLFVALRGERFDGHDFVGDVFARGARGAVVEKAAEVDEAGALYRVGDTLVALGRLAAHRRRALPARVVGITGSSGKTLTKDFTAGALSGELRVHATPGNLNNRIGLPLTLLSAPASADVVVAEMGTNEPGEIALLTDIAGPDVGVVTTVGESHLEKLGSIEGVLNEKLALVRGLGPEGWAVVGDTPPELPTAARGIGDRVRVAGWSERADEDLRPEAVDVDAGGRHTFTWRGQRVRLHVPGRHAVHDAMLALAVSELLDVPPRSAALGVAGVSAGAMRTDVRRVGDGTLVVDCYNANPQSVAAALDLLGALPEPRVAVLGTMLELGDFEDALHERVLMDALERPLHTVVACGAFASAAERLGASGEEPLLIAEPDPFAAWERLSPLLRGREQVLIKASRGFALERLIPAIEARLGPDAGSSGGSEPAGREEG